MKWVASLPMYNVSRELGAQWRALLAEVVSDAVPASFVAVSPSTARVSDADAVARVDDDLVANIEAAHDVALIDAPEDLMTLWTRPDLLLSQTCGYPLMRALPDSIELVATPMFDAPGCDGPHYRSVIVVSARAHAAGATTLEACRGLRAAFNDAQSNSGFNAFRHAVAPHARNGRFFGSSINTGSHIASLQALATQQADVAAIDCVTLALVRDTTPALLNGIQVIGMTAPSPGLPLIASSATTREQRDRLRTALNKAVTRNPSRARALRLNGFATLTRSDYQSIIALEHAARSLDYATLA